MQTIALYAVIALMACAVMIDRKQTMTFLMEGRREINPVAWAVMSLWRSDEEGYRPGARIWFGLALGVLGCILASVLMGYVVAPAIVLGLWAPFQLWCIWHNRKLGIKSFDFFNL